MAGAPDLNSGPTISRILLGTELRKLREEAGITPQEAGAAIRASHAKISRLELGRVGFKERDIEDLLTLYDVHDEKQRAGYLSLVSRSNERGWWSQDTDLLPSWFEMYLRLEQEASFIRTFQVQFVPGLMQSPQYARNVIRRGSPPIPTTRSTAASSSGWRGRRSCTNGAPRLWAVVDEAALTRPFGPTAVMRGQFEHILELTALPNVTLQVLPFRAGMHAAAGGPFSILRFAVSDLPDVVYLEQLNSSTYVDKRSDVEEYLWVMERLTVQAHTPVNTKAFVHGLLKQL